MGIGEPNEYEITGHTREQKRHIYTIQNNQTKHSQ